jgi:hypothetical protein
VPLKEQGKYSKEAGQARKQDFTSHVFGQAIGEGTNRKNWQIAIKTPDGFETALTLVLL